MIRLNPVKLSGNLLAKNNSSPNNNRLSFKMGIEDSFKRRDSDHSAKNELIKSLKELRKEKTPEYIIPHLSNLTASISQVKDLPEKEWADIYKAAINEVIFIDNKRNPVSFFSCLAENLKNLPENSRKDVFEYALGKIDQFQEDGAENTNYDRVSLIKCIKYLLPEDRKEAFDEILTRGDRSDAEGYSLIHRELADNLDKLSGNKDELAAQVGYLIIDLDLNSPRSYSTLSGLEGTFEKLCKSIKDFPEDKKVNTLEKVLNKLSSSKKPDKACETISAMQVRIASFGLSKEQEEIILNLMEQKKVKIGSSIHKTYSPAMISFIDDLKETKKTRGPEDFISYLENTIGDIPLIKDLKKEERADAYKVVIDNIVSVDNKSKVIKLFSCLSNNLKELPEGDRRSIFQHALNRIAEFQRCGVKNTNYYRLGLLSGIQHLPPKDAYIAYNITSSSLDRTNLEGANFVYNALARNLDIFSDNNDNMLLQFSCILNGLKSSEFGTFSDDGFYGALSELASKIKYVNPPSTRKNFIIHILNLLNTSKHPDKAYFTISAIQNDIDNISLAEEDKKQVLDLMEQGKDSIRSAYGNLGSYLQYLPEYKRKGIFYSALKKLGEFQKSGDRKTNQDRRILAMGIQYLLPQDRNKAYNNMINSLDKSDPEGFNLVCERLAVGLYCLAENKNEIPNQFDNVEMQDQFDKIMNNLNPEASESFNWALEMFFFSVKYFSADRRINNLKTVLDKFNSSKNLNDASKKIVFMQKNIDDLELSIEQEKEALALMRDKEAEIKALKSKK